MTDLVNCPTCGKEGPKDGAHTCKGKPTAPKDENGTSTLKKCPCGQIPRSLNVYGSLGDKYLRAYPECCASWEFEFRSGFEKPDSDEAQQKAIKEWNLLPRFWENA